MKFKLPAGVTSDEFFKKMQPVFISKYGWDIERGDHGELTVLDKKYKRFIWAYRWVDFDYCRWFR